MEIAVLFSELSVFVVLQNLIEAKEIPKEGGIGSEKTLKSAGIPQLTISESAFLKRDLKQTFEPGTTGRSSREATQKNLMKSGASAEKINGGLPNGKTGKQTEIMRSEYMTALKAASKIIHGESITQRCILQIKGTTGSALALKAGATIEIPYLVPNQKIGRKTKDTILVDVRFYLRDLVS